jgi:hypothetical protein
MKSVNTKLRRKNLELVPQQFDPAFGPIYTISSTKTGITNSAIALQLQYAGEMAKYSATRAKAIDKASKRTAKAKGNEEVLTESPRSESP